MSTPEKRYEWIRDRRTDPREIERVLFHTLGGSDGIPERREMKYGALLDEAIDAELDKPRAALNKQVAQSLQELEECLADKEHPTNTPHVVQNALQVIRLLRDRR